MKFNIVSYLIGEGLGNVFKNKKSTFSAMLVMCISMLVFGLFFIIGENVNHIMETVQSSQEIQVFIKNDATDEEIQKVGEEINKIDGVKNTTFVSKDEALDIMQDRLGEKGYLLQGDEENNFLKASDKVTFTDLKLANKVESEINNIENISKITSSNETMTKLISVANGVRLVTGVILVALVIGSIFIISSSILFISVSDKNNKFSFFIFNLSALIFTCSADSSPDTYNILPLIFIFSHICNIRVDFPIPGSPPSNIKEPFTNPPPKTLSNSLNPVEILSLVDFTILFNSIGFDFSFDSFP